MIRTFMLELPNRIGALLEVARELAPRGVNITRVSYNKLVDTHMLFLEAQGTPKQLEQAEVAIESLGFLQRWSQESDVLLFEFCLP